ncbi:MAG: PTS glucitol/sorbitol transporter subunit IIA [Nakamurella sp.]
MPEGHETIYATTVVGIGSMVEDFLKMKMLITFGEGAPTELLDICVLHRPDVRTGGVRPGDVVLLDGREFEVFAVGDVADQNLRALGHVSFKANGLRTAPLPGDICLGEVDLPLLRTGSTMRIVSGSFPVPTERTS